MNNKRKIVSLAVSTAIILGSYATTFAMPDLFRITQSNGNVVQYSMNEAIDTPILYQRMMDNIAQAFGSERNIVGELLSGKLVNIGDSLTSGNYNDYEKNVENEQISEAIDIVATHRATVGENEEVIIDPVDGEEPQTPEEPEEENFEVIDIF